MQRNVFAVVLTAVLLVGAVAAVPVGALSDNGGGLSYAGNDTAPGEQFAGTVSVGEAEVENDVEERAFANRLSEADNDSERAAVIAAELNETEDRLAELREQREQLRTAYENGEISEREYRVKTAKLAAQLSGVEEITNRSETAAAGIPNGTLAANGVDTERIDRLRSSASELRGGEVADIARNIAGPNAGGSPGERPDEAANRSEAGGPDDRAGGGDRGEGQQSGTDEARTGTENGARDGTESAADANSGGATTESGPDGTESSTTADGSDADGSGTDDGTNTEDGGSSGTEDGSTAGPETDETTTDEPTGTEQA